MVEHTPEPSDSDIGDPVRSPATLDMTPADATAMLIEVILYGRHTVRIRTMTGRPAAVDTAQTAFKIMLRDQIAPALRKMGFKGSGNSYEMFRDGYRVLIQVQRSKFSTRDSVQFDANVSDVHPPTIELFNKENERARQQGKDLENGGGYSDRLNNLAGGNAYGFPWIVKPDEPRGPVAEDFIECVRRYFLPVIEEETRRPLPSPTPLNERADRSYRDE